MRSVAKCVAALLVVACVAGGTAYGQVVDHVWTGGTGSQDWLTGSNWDLATAPNDPLQAANLSVGLASNLNVNIGAVDDVTVAGITLGGTSTAVTTQVTSSGARLLLNNGFSLDAGNADFDSDNDVDLADLMIWQRGYGLTAQDSNVNGDANLDTNVDGLDLTDPTDGWQANFGLDGNISNRGRAFINSEGVAGSVNKILVNIHQDNEPIDVRGTNDVTIGVLGSTAITFEGRMEGDVDPVLTSAANISVLTSGITATIESSINLVDQNYAEGNQYGLKYREQLGRGHRLEGRGERCRWRPPHRCRCQRRSEAPQHRADRERQ